MTFHVRFRWGRTELDPSVDRLRLALAELDAPDPEHGSAALQHESEWCLEAHAGGLLVWENVEQGEPRHLKDVPRDKVLELWLALAAGDLETVEKAAWVPGYG